MKILKELSAYGDRATAKDIPIIGIMISIISGVMRSGLSAIIQHLNEGDDVWTLLAVSYIIQATLQPMVMNAWRAPFLPTRKETHWVVIRNIFGFIASVAMLVSPLFITLGEASAIQTSAIAFAMLFGRICLGERCHVIEVLGAALALLGCGLMAQPDVIFGSDSLSISFIRHLIGVGLSLAAAVSWASSSVIVRRRLRYTHPGTIAFWAAIGGCVLFATTVLAKGKSLIICDKRTRVIMLVVGLGSTLQTVLVVAAYRFCSAGLTTLVTLTASTVTGFTIQLMRGVHSTAWSYAGAAAVGLALALNIGRITYQHRKDEMTRDLLRVESVTPPLELFISQKEEKTEALDLCDYVPPPA